MSKGEKVIFSKNDMCIMGDRVRECRKQANLSQNDVINLISELPENRGKQRNVKHLSAIENGRIELSLEYAELLALVLNVRSEYLLAKDKYKTDAEMFLKRRNLFHKRDHLSNDLLNLAGFEVICDFISNWKELNLDLYNGPFPQGVSPGNYHSIAFGEKAKILTEIKTPNGKHFYCEYEDIQLLSYELIEYLRFRMQQLESKYAWRFDSGEISRKIEGSEICTYPVKNASENPDFLVNSIWVSHEDNFFPDINSNPESFLERTTEVLNLK